MATITGTGGDDLIFGTNEDDLISGGLGNDILVGGGGNDAVYGGDGNDVLVGGVPGSPNPVQAGNNLLDGGLGDDHYEVSSPTDVLVDAGGIDLVEASVSWTLGDGFENLFLWGAESHFGFGNRLDNLIIGSPAANLLAGDHGDDVVKGGAGDDTLNGDNGDDRLGGEAGNDRLDGGKGHDTLDGGAGHDILAGDAGADVFLFSQPTAPEVFGFDNTDHITDFKPRVDRLAFESTVFRYFGDPGSFARQDPRFLAAPGAVAGQTPEHRLVYDTTTGHLYNDPDGSGAAQAQLIGTLDGQPRLAATDIFVI